MSFTWSTPKDWDPNTILTADEMDQYVSENLRYLLSPNHQRILRDNGGDYSINSVGTFQDIDGTNLSIDLVAHGGPIWVHLLCAARLNSSGEGGYFDIGVDGTRVGAAYTKGLAAYVTGTNVGVIPVNISILLTGLSADTYTLRPQWRCQTNNVFTLKGGTSENPILFEAIEL